jgi:hypothetical protein
MAPSCCEQIRHDSGDIHALRHPGDRLSMVRHEKVGDGMDPFRLVAPAGFERAALTTR